MAIDSNVYSGKQFELYLAIESGNMGTAESTNANFVKLAVNSISDVDFSGITQERNLRVGQQVKKPSDHYVSQKGASYTLGFEWIVDHEEGLQKLLQLISEDTASDFSVTGTFSPAVYAHGAATGQCATVIISNPNSGDDRTLTSCILTSLTLSMDAGSDGGRLKAAGTFYTGYKPTIGSSAVSPTGTQTSFVKTIFDCTTKTIGGNDVVASSFSLTMNYPGVRIGYQGSDADPEQYARSDEYTASGSMNVKYDGNSDGELAFFLNGTEKAIAFGDGATNIHFTCGQVVYTGFNTAFDNPEGAMVEVPFDCVADGSESLYRITAT